MPRIPHLPLSPLGVLIAVIVGLLIAVVVVGLMQGILDATVVAMGLMGLVTTGLFTVRSHPDRDHDRGPRD